jgi:Putative peptidoglycan binding domain
MRLDVSRPHMFCALVLMTCAASELKAQTQFQARPIIVQRSVATARTNPAVVPRNATAQNPVVRNISPVRPLSVQQSATIRPQRLNPAQSRALNNAVRNNNYNLYRNRQYAFPSQVAENSTARIARLQGVIRSGMQPTLIQPGAGLGYGSEMVRQVQTALRQLGYYHGQVDGQFGSSTQDALQNYQLKANRPATGLLDRQTLSQLGVESKNSR